VRSAICAANSFARHSPVFASSVLPIVASIVSRFDVSSSAKLRILPILRATLHNESTIQQTRAVCVEMLSSLPLCAFTCHLISLLTHISLRTHLYVVEQIDFLLHQLESDVRPQVHSATISALTEMARSVPAFFSEGHVQQLVKAVPVASTSIQISIFRLLAELFQSPLCAPFVQTLDFVGLLPVLQAHEDDAALAHFLLLFSSAVAADPSAAARSESLRFVTLALSCVYRSIAQQQPNQDTLKAVLVSIERLSRVFPEHALLVSDSLCGALALSLSNGLSTVVADVCSALEAACCCTPLSDQAIATLMAVMQDPRSPRALACILNVLPRELNDPSFAAVFPHTLQTLAATTPFSAWDAYALLRQMLIIGSPHYASVLSQHIDPTAFERNTRSWMLALQSLTAASLALAHDRCKILPGLINAVDSLCAALVHLDAARTQALSFSFQRRLVSIYIRLSISRPHRHLDPFQEPSSYFDSCTQASPGPSRAV
jgi:hypothetical protein